MTTRHVHPARDAADAAALEPSVDAELARVLRICDPGPFAGALTFSPATPVSTEKRNVQWRVWQDDVFTLLAPAMIRAAAHAARDRASELLEEDRALSRLLGSGERERALRAGRTLLERLSAARGSRWVAKFRAWADVGQAPASFPIIYAGQCALFHIPARLALLSYAFCEWRAASPGHVTLADARAPLESTCPLIESALTASAPADTRFASAE